MLNVPRCFNKASHVALILDCDLGKQLGIILGEASAYATRSHVRNVI